MAVCLAIELGAVSLSRAAHAQEVVRSAEEDRPDDGDQRARSGRAWYGWQIAIADAASGGLTYAGVEADRAVLLYGGLSLFLIVPPAIHGANDRSSSGGPVFASFGSRLLVPLLMFLNAARGGRSEDGGTGVELEAEDQPQPSYGVMFVVSMLDVAIWSIPNVWERPSPRNRTTTTLRPRISLHPERAVLGATGTF